MFDNALTISAGLPAVLFLLAGLVPAVLVTFSPFLDPSGMLGF